jgi:hypothetical protein
MDGMPYGESARPGAVAVVVNMVRISGRGEERIPPSLAGFSPFHSFSIFIFFFLLVSSICVSGSWVSSDIVSLLFEGTMEF